MSSRLRLVGIQCRSVALDSSRESCRNRRRIHEAVKGEGRSFLDVFGEVFSSDAGLVGTALIEEVGTEGGGTSSNIGEEDEGGVESAMNTGVEPVFITEIEGG